MAKILVIEDEVSLQLLLEFDLKSYNYEVELCADGKKGLEKLKNEYYDLAIIDWMLPSLSGYDIIAEIRKTNEDLKIIMLTAKDGEMDIVKGLEIGADDYLTKPFSSRELNARMKVLLKTKDSNIISFSNIVIDKAKRQVKRDDENIDLSKLEFDLLLYFYDNKDIVVSREMIYEKLWNQDEDIDLRVIDTHVSSIKKKLKIKDNIVSKRGVGYLFTI
ncbi:DNA-binding response OmpR family regulator [Bacilli bacterium PM5-3]|nr:DNA-binding response OmpR family regulator [Bacilli bacterium PM5-3]MDH6603468.1 DNA-binding response OmpR family regulator [Bacilli bacterium PM5-9]